MIAQFFPWLAWEKDHEEVRATAAAIPEGITQWGHR